jgi:putative ABC transport system permease protein
MSALNRKLLRDLRRLWAQALAIALVMAAGVATLILGNGAYASLAGTRAAYYEASRFADVFASATRAPAALGARIAEIDGVLAVDTRIVKIALLDMPGMVEPGSVALISLPEAGADGLSRLYLRSGRLPDPQVTSEVAVSEGFAKAHRLRPGARFAVLMNGQRRSVTVTGIALSPEYIYTIGPGDMMPDERRFGVVWIPEASLAAAYDLEGAFSDVVLKLVPGTPVDKVVAELDTLLARYGGLGATERKDQISHAFLDAELMQLRGMSRILPPIFLLVAAFLVNMTMARLVLLERELIGLLKAIGYSRWAVASHYMQFVALIALIGVLIGSVAGTWLGNGMATMYARFFNFPYLVFVRSPEIYTIATLITVAAALLGAANAVRTVTRLSPAVAMAPPSPPRYRRLFGELLGLTRVVHQSSVMVARHLLHFPFRTGSSILGIAFATAVLTGSTWSIGSIEKMIDITFFQTDRQDATISFSGALPYGAYLAVQRLPGVIRAEPQRGVAVRISHGNVHRKVGLYGKPADADLSRILDPDLLPMTLPDHGVILSETLADILRVRTGETVEMELLEGDRRILTLPVSGLSVGYVGIGAYMRLDRLNAALGEGAMISGVHVATDPLRAAEFFAAAKATPQTRFLMLQPLALQKFRDTMAENITIMITVYVVLATIIAVGVVYNFARISLSEQGRELASLRVLGFTKGEVSKILFRELAVIVLLAQPIGWLMGYGIAVMISSAFASELYRVPLVVGPEVFAYATLIVGVTGIASAVLMRGRINRLDMIEVLKTRE